MTIDEAIEQYANAECGTCPTLFCEECVKGDKRQQIAEWLEELKAYKQNTDICHICDTYCSYLADEFENGYNKAIDDFAENIRLYYSLKQEMGYVATTYEDLINYIFELAEQLKSG